MPIVIALTPIVFNFRNIFGIGIYNAEDDYFNSYSDGTAGINLHLHVKRKVDFAERYEINTFVEPISTGNVVNYGLLSINIFYLKDNSQVFSDSVQFGTPRSSYSVYQFNLKLVKYDKLTCYGVIEMSLETGGIPTNDTINFQLSIIVPLGVEDYRNIDLALYVLLFFHFFLYIIVPVVLIWIFKPIFGLSYSEEVLKRDEKFFEYLRNQTNEIREESKN